MASHWLSCGVIIGRACCWAKGQSSFFLLEGNSRPCCWAELGTFRWGLGLTSPVRGNRFQVLGVRVLHTGLPSSNTAAVSVINSRCHDWDVVQMASGGQAGPFIGLGGSDKGIYFTIAYEFIYLGFFAGLHIGALFHI